MKEIRYVCTHCGRHFEAEEKDILECPGCFWSSSVKKEEDVRADVQDQERKNAPGVKAASKPFFRLPALTIDWRRAGLVLLVGVSLVVVVVSLYTFLSSRGCQAGGERATSGKANKTDIRISKPLTGPSAEATGTASLSADEKAVLERRVELTASRPVSDEEKRILEKVVPLSTGVVEKLPFQPWTLENFETMLASQESHYKVPLPRSYRNKLKKGFEQDYLAGKTAFEAGDIVKARDAWVQSLVFPIYGNDIQKHRGVVLTMLRPFIQDTLSKIAALNTMLSERAVRDKETLISADYEQLAKSLSAQNWTDAYAAVGRLEAGLGEIEKLDPNRSALPPYPAAVQQVDEGIRATLMELLSIPPPAVADLAGLRADVLMKKGIVESFLPERIAQLQAGYEDVVGKIQLGQWQGAAEILRRENFPPVMLKDIQEKTALLKKAAKPGLDSPSDSG